MNTYLRLMTMVFVIVSAALVLPGLSAAQLDPWEFEVYPYRTLGRGTAELESLNSVVAKGHHSGDTGTSSGTLPSQSMWRTAFELTYGLTDRIETSAYVNLAKPSGYSFQYAGAKFRLRGSLFDQGELPLDLGWYIELESHRVPEFDDQKLEIELRPIIQKDLGNFSLMLNPIFEKILDGPDKHQSFEFGYAAGAYYRWTRLLSPGLEFYGGVGKIAHADPSREQQHYIAPVLRGEFAHGIEYNVGAAFGLTPGSDRVIIKFNLELERFVGAIFGPSSGSIF